MINVFPSPPPLLALVLPLIVAMLTACTYRENDTTPPVCSLLRADECSRGEECAVHERVDGSEVCVSVVDERCRDSDDCRSDQVCEYPAPCYCEPCPPGVHCGPCGCIPGETTESYGVCTARTGPTCWGRGDCALGEVCDQSHTNPDTDEAGTCVPASGKDCYATSECEELEVCAGWDVATQGLSESIDLPNGDKAAMAVPGVCVRRQCTTDDECPSVAQCQVGDEERVGICVDTASSCGDDSRIVCGDSRPTCLNGGLAVPQNGCWACVDPESCLPPDNDGDRDTYGPFEGGSIAVVCDDDNGLSTEIYLTERPADDICNNPRDQAYAHILAQTGPQPLIEGIDLETNVSGNLVEASELCTDRGCVSIVAASAFLARDNDTMSGFVVNYDVYTADDQHLTGVANLRECGAVINCN